MNCRREIKPFSVNLNFLNALKEKRIDDVYTNPVAVCHVMDLHEHGMKLFDFIEGKKILIIKQKGRIYAMGNVCTHMGGELSKGVLGDRRVRCPMHGACFNIETGDIEDFPGLDSVPSYKVEINLFGQVLVRARVRDLPSHRRLKNMTVRDPNNALTFVIIGGGASGAMCAETLRQEGFTGRIIMVCRESHLPYDRVKISKDLDLRLEDIQLRTSEFYTQHDIEVLLDNEAIKANMEERTVTLAGDQCLKYDKMFIGTGCSSKFVKVKGSHLRNVLTVRDFEDWKRIKKVVNSEKTVVCLGASFMILEVAQTLSTHIQCKVFVIGRSQVPMLSIFGYKIGERILQLYRDENIEMIMGNSVTEIIGDSSGKVTHVVLSDGRTLDCDVFVMGIGVKHNTNFLIGSGLPINADGSIEADMYLTTLRNNVYVGGDIAYAPVHSNNNQRACIGHQQLAQYHGRIAAINMAGFRLVEVRAVPYYSTTLFGVSIRCAGYGLYSDVIIEGDLDDLKFTAYYVNDQDVVVAIAACNLDLIVSQYAELIYQGGILRGKELLQGKKRWTHRLKTIVKC